MFTDYGKPPGKWPPLVKDACPTVVLVYSFHFQYSLSRRTAIFSNYHIRLLAPSQHRRNDLTIYSICNVVQGLENRLANWLLRLPLRKQSLRALRCFFPKRNGMSRHSSPFLGLQMPKRKGRAFCPKQLPLKSEQTLSEPSLKRHRRCARAEKPTKGGRLC